MEIKYDVATKDDINELIRETASGLFFEKAWQ